MSQIDFYMSAADESRFLDYALGEQDLVLLPGIQPGAEPAPIDRTSLPPPGSIEDRTLYLAPRSRSAETRYRPVPTQTYHAVDMAGPVIRWMRSAPDGRGVPERGWIYYNSERSRGHDVELAFRRLGAWIRGRYRKVPGERAYAGEEAWALLLMHRRHFPGGV